MLKREEAALLKMDDGANKKKERNCEQEVTEDVATSAKLVSDSEAVHSCKREVNSCSRDLTCAMDIVATSGNRELKQLVNSVEGSGHAISMKKHKINSIKHNISCDTQEGDNYLASAKTFEDRLDSLDGNPLDEQSVTAVDHSSMTGLFTSAIAHMAVAKFHHMAALNVETFGDDWSDGDVTDDGDDETV